MIDHTTRVVRHWLYGNQNKRMSLVRNHLWQLWAPRAAETKCYTFCGISKIASSAPLRPGIVDMYSANGT